MNKRSVYIYKGSTQSPEACMAVLKSKCSRHSAQVEEMKRREKRDDIRYSRRYIRWCVRSFDVSTPHSPYSCRNVEFAVL